MVPMISAISARRAVRSAVRERSGHSSGAPVWRRALLALALAVGLPGCGQLGPLYQPPAEVQQPADEAES